MRKTNGELIWLLIGLILLAAILAKIWTYVVGGLALFGGYYLFSHFNQPPPGPPRCRR